MKLIHLLVLLLSFLLVTAAWSQDRDRPAERPDQPRAERETDRPREGVRDGDRPREREVQRDGDRPREREGVRDGDRPREREGVRDGDRVSPEALRDAQRRRMVEQGGDRQGFERRRLPDLPEGMSAEQSRQVIRELQRQNMELQHQVRELKMALQGREGGARDLERRERNVAEQNEGLERRMREFAQQMERMQVQMREMHRQMEGNRQKDRHDAAADRADPGER